MTQKAHARGLKVYMGTITPFKGCKGYYTKAREKARQTVNEWIRTTHETDGFIDFDAVMRNPQKPGQLRKEWQSGDWLHPNPEGYKRWASTPQRFWHTSWALIRRPFVVRDCQECDETCPCRG